MSGTTWTKFYWADWSSDPALQHCSYAARGLWMDMLCIAAAHDPIGYVAVAGRGLDETSIARMTGGLESEVSALLGELAQNGVFSRDRHGRIYSRRMVSDARKAAIARKNGREGGNPSLCKTEGNKPSDKGRVKGSLKPHIPRASSPVEISDANASSGLTAIAPGKPVDEVRIAYDEWNELAARRNLPVARKLDPGRRKLIRARLDDGGLDAWRQALRAVEASPLCRGQNDRNWRADLDFVCTESRWRRLLEGFYGLVPAPSPLTIVKPVDAAELQRRLRYFTDTGDWPAAWGERPKEAA